MPTIISPFTTTDTRAKKHVPMVFRRDLGVLWVVLIAVACGISTAKAYTSIESPIICPVKPGKEVDPDISTEYEGQSVYFCCQKCRVKFETSPDRYASALATTSGTADHHASGAARSDTHTPRDFDQDFDQDRDFDQDHDNDRDFDHDFDQDHDRDFDHDKDHDQASGSTWSGVSSAIGRFHPIAVHFPIALLVSAALIRCLMLAGSLQWAGSAVRLCVLLGGASAVVAATLGWLNAGWPGGDESFGDVLFNHRWLGVSTAVWGVVLITMVQMESRKPSQTLSRLITLALLVGAGLVGAAGYFGGIMVFGPDYLPW